MFFLSVSHNGTGRRGIIVKHRFVCVSALTFGVVAGLACRPNESARVRMEFEQLANFHTYVTDSGSTTGASDGLFVLYKITRIANNGSQAKVFTFDKNKVTTFKGTHQYNAEPSGDFSLLQHMSVHNVTVQPGETVNNPGCFIKHFVTPDFETLLSGHTGMVELVYATTDEQPISLSRKNGDNTTALFSPGTRALVQSYCGS
jgi:hypothetical protein